VDTGGQILTGSQRIAAAMTIRNGRVAFQAGEATGSPSIGPRRLWG
jgi:hypothetical protein